MDREKNLIKSDETKIQAGRPRQGEEGHNKAMGQAGGTDCPCYAGNCGDVWGFAGDCGEDVAGD